MTEGARETVRKDRRQRQGDGTDGGQRKRDRETRVTARQGQRGRMGAEREGRNTEGQRRGNREDAGGTE